MNINKAVIPAAGYGTRFLPASKAIPKEMIPVVDKPTIQYVVEEAVRAGIEEVMLVTGRNKEEIENHFDRDPELEQVLAEKGKNEMLERVKYVSDLITIHTVRQKEQRGLGHAVAHAEAFVGDEYFAVLLGDDIMHSEKPVIGQLIDHARESGKPVIGCQEVSRESIQLYGSVDCEERSKRRAKVSDLIEKPAPEEAPSTLAVLGRYVLPPEIFPIIDETPPGKGGEIQLTDAIKILAERQHVEAFNFRARRYDVGSKQGFLQATVEHALRREDISDEFRSYLKKLLNGEIEQED
ncbi:UTP--glucose-1-phosphate uridylyltransferase GalU [Halarsenatibacter silvermanii]|uniref:UTP--glucose-1-phosphate uridylyltransferase n=1 Tax=Halarsenatibacter silvermanii TaxID=321763 RepID=A0A1G9LXK1_9FIRM|nr:UTP--glucose-1-phosphate uridylyltransferase GalU [Halarsenatibacter silvermanii]SDL66633.1 UDP-glucose pyrophosphorylase [Halarsenatibacter silvermanii]